MKKFISSKKVYTLILLIVIIYFCSILIKQQIKLNSYVKQKEYYQGELEKENKKQEDLLSMQENVNSPEYIEKIARDKLDMYLPNERVYIDISK